LILPLIGILPGVGFSPGDQFYRRFRVSPETVTLPLGSPIGGPFFLRYLVSTA